MKKTKRFAIIRFDIREFFEISCNEYAFCEMVYNLSNNPSSKFRGWANARNIFYAKEIGVTDRAIQKIKSRMIEKDLIKRNPVEKTCICTTQKWYDSAVEGRTKFAPKDELSSPLPRTKFTPTTNKVHPKGELSSCPSDKDIDKDTDINTDIFLKEKFSKFKPLEFDWVAWKGYLLRQYKTKLEGEWEEDQLSHLMNCADDDLKTASQIIDQAKAGKFKNFTRLIGNQKNSAQKKMPNKWNPKFYKSLKEVADVQAYVRHLKKLGYTKQTAGSGATYYEIVQPEKLRHHAS